MSNEDLSLHHIIRFPQVPLRSVHLWVNRLLLQCFNCGNESICIWKNQKNQKGCWERGALERVTYSVFEAWTVGISAVLFDLQCDFQGFTSSALSCLRRKKKKERLILRYWILFWFRGRESRNDTTYPTEGAPQTSLLSVEYFVDTVSFNLLRHFTHSKSASTVL